MPVGQIVHNFLGRANPRWLYNFQLQDIDELQGLMQPFSGRDDRDRRKS